MKHLLTALSALLLMTACNNSPKILVLYYSQTGVTKAVAEEIQAQTGADICSFDVVQVYDGTYDETIQRCIEERSRDYTPELQEISCDLSQYDIIFLGYPIWFGSYAPPVKALLASGRLNGKTIVPFCSFGSGGLYSSGADLKAALGDADIRQGYGVRAARIDAVPGELNRFLIENGWKEGEIEPLAAFSSAEEVSEEQAAIFQEACAGYKYPLGTPKTASVRPVQGGCEYLFTAEGLSPDGQTSQSEIYILALDGERAVFTQVVRK